MRNTMTLILLLLALWGVTAPPTSWVKIHQDAWAFASDDTTLITSADQEWATMCSGLRVRFLRVLMYPNLYPSWPYLPYGELDLISVIKNGTEGVTDVRCQLSHNGSALLWTARSRSGAVHAKVFLRGHLGSGADLCPVPSSCKRRDWDCTGWTAAYRRDILRDSWGRVSLDIESTAFSGTPLALVGAALSRNGEWIATLHHSAESPADQREATTRIRSAVVFRHITCSDGRRIEQFVWLEGHVEAEESSRLVFSDESDVLYIFTSSASSVVHLSMDSNSTWGISYSPVPTASWITASEATGVIGRRSELACDSESSFGRGGMGCELQARHRRELWVTAHNASQISIWAYSARVEDVGCEGAGTGRCQRCTNGVSREAGRALRGAHPGHWQLDLIDTLALPREAAVPGVGSRRLLIDVSRDCRLVAAARHGERGLSLYAWSSRAQVFEPVGRVETGEPVVGLAVWSQAQHLVLAVTARGTILAFGRSPLPALAPAHAARRRQVRFSRVAACSCASWVSWRASWV